MLKLRLERSKEAQFRKMSNIIYIILAGILALYIFYRFAKKKADKNKELEKDEIVIEKVKAATYIVCPRCGAHLEVEVKDE